MSATFHIPSFSPEVLFHIGPLPITNTIINAWLAILIFVGLGLALRWQWSPTATGKLQNLMEMFLDTMLGYFDQVTGDRKKTLKFLPIVGSIFFFILVSNWLGLLPGTGSIKVGENFLLRPANTDLNLTAAMALTAVLGSHILGFFAIGVFAHIGKFIQIKGIIKSVTRGPIAIFTALIEAMVGVLEIVSELAKVLSLSLRLFGNIFAGEVLMTVITGLVGLVVPVPFMLLEILVGLIQATVFAMLVLVYLTVATSEPHGEEAEAGHH